MEVQESGQAIVIIPTDAEVQDGPSLQNIRNHLYQLVDAGRHEMIVDFHKVHYLLASAAIALLISLQKRLRMAGGTLVLRNMNSHVRDLFRVTRLDSLFDIRPNPPGKK
ncbi:MAG: STAS domain-containing protein [Gemmataceae bacterium]|nr:STAS domain-containing protein [Gemmataceae bacterium]